MANMGMLVRARRQYQRRIKNMKNSVILMSIATVVMLLLAGCGEKKCFFVSQEGKALVPDAPVVWYDAYVGRVDALEAVAEETKVSFRLNKKFAEEIRDGVAGRVVNDPKISPKAFVLLVGGRDKSRSLVENGAQIPESRATNAISEGFSAFVEWLKGSKRDELVIVGIVLLVLFVLLKFVAKLIKLAVFVAILCVIVYACLSANIGWDNYKEQLSTAKAAAQEAGNWLQQYGGKLHDVLNSVLEAK